MSNDNTPTPEPVAELKHALQLAKRFHGSQLRAIGPDMGLPYFDTHVVRVVRAAPEFAKPAAALHDALEDTELSVAYLQRQGMDGVLSWPTVDAVVLLTRGEGQVYADYVASIAAADGLAGVIARAVKLADLMDNLSTLPEGRLRNRYVKALATIAAAINTRGEA